MAHQRPGARIFINLPVEDVERSMAFWTKLGYGFDATLCSQQAACLVLSDSVCAMLLTRAVFSGFTDKDVPDGHTATRALLCLSAPSRQAVDDLVNLAVAAGGREPRPAMAQDGSYGRAFDDLDGQTWEILWRA